MGFERLSDGMNIFTSFTRPTFDSTPYRYKIKSLKEVKQFSYKFFHFLINLTTFKLHNVDIFHIFTSQTIITIAISLYSHPLYSNNFFVFSYHIFEYNFFFFQCLTAKKEKGAREIFCTKFDFREVDLKRSGVKRERKPLVPFQIYVSWLLFININISISFILRTKTIIWQNMISVINFFTI